MFLDRLSAELAAPHNRLSELDERLHLDVDRYRALMMQEARALCEGGHIDAQVVAWAFSCIADGWIDEHLQHLRDSLLELGAITDQGHLDRLLRAAERHGVRHPLVEAGIGINLISPMYQRQVKRFSTRFNCFFHSRSH